jgi:hypothetical protein
MGKEFFEAFRYINHRMLPRLTVTSEKRFVVMVAANLEQYQLNRFGWHGCLRVPKSGSPAI